MGATGVGAGAREGEENGRAIRCGSERREDGATGAEDDNEFMPFDDFIMFMLFPRDWRRRLATEEPEAVVSRLDLASVCLSLLKMEASRKSECLA